MVKRQKTDLTVKPCTLVAASHVQDATGRLQDARLMTGN